MWPEKSGEHESCYARGNNTGGVSQEMLISWRFPCRTLHLLCKLATPLWKKYLPPQPVPSLALNNLQPPKFWLPAWVSEVMLLQNLLYHEQLCQCVSIFAKEEEKNRRLMTVLLTNSYFAGISNSHYFN